MVYYVTSAEMSKNFIFIGVHFTESPLYLVSHCLFLFIKPHIIHSLHKSFKERGTLKLMLAPKATTLHLFFIFVQFADTPRLKMSVLQSVDKRDM